jgi:uncharacterized integral membrane protein
MHLKQTWGLIKPEKTVDGDGGEKKLTRSQTIRLQNVAKSVKAQVGGLLVCYIVVLFSAIQSTGTPLAQLMGTPWEATLAIIVSSLLIVEGLVLIVFIAKLSDNMVKVIAFTMFGLGFLEAFICTFRSPFNSTGNGYFASWLGLICAMAVSVPLLPAWLKNLIQPGDEGDEGEQATTSSSKVAPSP